MTPVSASRRSVLSWLSCCGGLGLAGCETPPGAAPAAPAARIPFTPGGRPIGRIAVVTLERAGIPMARAEDLAVETLVQQGYEIVNLADVRTALKEAVARDNAYFDRAGNTQNLGRLLKVDAILVVQVTEVGTMKDTSTGREMVTRATASGRLIDAERGSVRWIRSAQRATPFVNIVLFGSAGVVEDAVRDVLSAFPEARR